MNFTQLKAFHALARTGCFTKAAEYLHVSQPAVTAQIKALERDYDVALFHRQGHNLTLRVREEITALFHVMRV